jgi:hypothetical protein
MNAALFFLEGFPVTVGETLAAALAACVALTVALILTLARGRSGAEVAELTGRLSSLGAARPTSRG